MASKYASGQFWLDTLDRAVATTAQAAGATLAAGVTGILQVDFVQLASVAGLAGAVSVLTSVAFRGNSKPVDDGGASGEIPISDLRGKL